MIIPYTLLDHTADLQIRVSGTDPADLFENAGIALFDLICDPGGLAAAETVEITVSGDDPADLMVNYLRELLYQWTGDQKLVKMVQVVNISDTALSARVTMAPYDPQRHEIHHEIKAVTYHQIEVSRTTDGWQAMVVFDV